MGSASPVPHLWVPTMPPWGEGTAPWLIPPCPSPAPISYLKGRSAVEFTPANDWLLLILATRTRRCGRADSDIVECDLEGLPAGTHDNGVTTSKAWVHHHMAHGKRLKPDAHHGSSRTWPC